MKQIAIFMVICVVAGFASYLVADLYVMPNVRSMDKGKKTALIDTSNYASQDDVKRIDSTLKKISDRILTLEEENRKAADNEENRIDMSKFEQKDLERLVASYEKMKSEVERLEKLQGVVAEKLETVEGGAAGSFDSQMKAYEAKKEQERQAEREARDAERAKEREEMTKKMIEGQANRLKEELGLTDQQASLVGDILTDASKKMMENFQKMRESGERPDRETMRTEMTKLQEETNKKMSEVLTEEQYKDYIDKGLSNPMGGGGRPGGNFGGGRNR